MENQLFEVLNLFPDIKVLVVGEGILDSYLKGTYDHLSSEAPVPVIELNEREDVPGGAANTAINVQSLGGRAYFLTIMGDDREGMLLHDALSRMGVNTDGILHQGGRQTLAKHRLLADSQMMARFDQGSVSSINRQGERALIAKLEQIYEDMDAVILSDYDYGIFTPRVVQALAELQRQSPRVMVADSKQLLRFSQLNITAVKPNYRQAIDLLGLPREKDLSARVDQMCAHAGRILEQVNTQIAAVTIDRDGALLFEREQPVYRTYARPVSYSSTAGAGDTYVAGLTLALAAGAQTPAAGEIASAAAAVVVQKPGTSTCYREELTDYFSGDDRILTEPFLVAARVAAHRRQGKRIVFTNGCFDILHSGHISYLNMAKSHGDVLIVGLNSDESVRRLKGPDRPINSLEERAQVLSALSSVDHIIPFYADTPIELIRMIAPDVFVKGGDYTRETLPEAAVVEELGGVVEILPYLKDRSTTGVIEKIRRQFLHQTAAQESGMEGDHA